MVRCGACALNGITSNASGYSPNSKCSYPAHAGDLDIALTGQTDGIVQVCRRAELGMHAAFVQSQPSECGLRLVFGQWLENGGSNPVTFAAHVIDPNCGGGHSVQAFDIDKDGDLDLVRKINQERSESAT